MKIQSNKSISYNFPQTKNIKIKNDSFNQRKDEKKLQYPSFYGIGSLFNKKQKGSVQIEIGTINTTSEKIVIDFDKKFVEKLSELQAKKGKPLHKQDLLAPENYMEQRFLDKLPESTYNFLSSLKETQPEKYALVHSILLNTHLRTKTAEGVTEEYQTNFVKKLSECHNVLLKNVVDNNIPIRIYDMHVAFNYKIGHAQFAQEVNFTAKRNELDRHGCLKLEPSLNEQFINLVERDFNGPIMKNGIPQNTVDSLPHELAHAFDYNNGRKLNLTKQNMVSVVLPEPNKLSINNDRFLDMPSFSKEFDTAIGEDIFRMFEEDKNLSIPQGTTFYSILNDREFSYYFGKANENDRQFDDIKARKELFAQLFSYACGSPLTGNEFQERIEDIFPNGLECARRILEEAEKL